MASDTPATPSSNPLITTKPADTTLTVQLHPLVLLTISDYITRHTLRSQPGPIVGAVIGQQSGRNYTLEHAYECKLDSELSGLDTEWFTQRLEQYKDVHKSPALDLVALFVVGEGPQEAHLRVLRQVQAATGQEGCMLLVFHAGLVDELQGGKLPVSLYEAVREDEGMRVRELGFEVETGQAEMIGVDFVAKGGGNATAVASNAADSSSEATKKGKGKGKGKVKEKEDDDAATATTLLSTEDEELIASLTAKSNAIKMLNQRLRLISTYLQTLPETYLIDPSSPTHPGDETNHPLLRSISALLSRVPLLTPPTLTSSTNGAAPQLSALESAGEKSRQDVHLTSLLAAMTRSVAEAQSMGAKFAVVQRERGNRERVTRGGGGGGVGGGRVVTEESLPFGEAGVMS